MRWTSVDSDGQRTIHEGFKPLTKTMLPTHVAIVMVDGENELWEVDGMRGFDLLVEYMSDVDNQLGYVKVLGMFNYVQYTFRTLSTRNQLECELDLADL